MSAETISLGTLDLSGLEENELLSFYGALFAMSAADRSMDQSETDRIFESLKLDQLSPQARERVFQFNIKAPTLESCLQELRSTSFSIRSGLMLNLIDIVLADNMIEPGEHEGLNQARQLLGITDSELSDMHEAAYAVQEKRSAADVKRPFQIMS